MVRAAADAVASLLFPAPCRICETLLDAASRIPICRACLEAMGPLPGPVCDRCGRPFPSLMTAESGPRQCLACRRGLYDFDLARSYADYNHTMARAVMLLKYSAVEPLAGWFAERLGELISLEPRLMEVDMVVPVPLDAARLRERGYNQAERIARPLARRLGLPLKPVLLLRKRPRPAKLKLTRRERWTTVHGAYAMRDAEPIDKARVLLLDDVFTTGATLDACSRALRAGGAAKVVAVTVARVTSRWALPPAAVG